MTPNEKMKIIFWLFGQYWRLEYETFLHYEGLSNREAFKKSIKIKYKDYLKWKENIPSYEWMAFTNSSFYDEIELPWNKIK